MSSEPQSMTAAEYRAETETEEDIHKAVVEWADRQAATEPALEMLFHVPNGGSRHVAEAVKLKEMGTRQGVPDLILPAPTGDACGLALELKSAQGYLRPEQAWWLQKLRKAGWAVAVAYTFSEAQEVIARYLDKGASGQSLDLGKASAPGHV